MFEEDKQKLDSQAVAATAPLRDEVTKDSLLNSPNPIICDTELEKHMPVLNCIKWLIKVVFT